MSNGLIGTLKRHKSKWDSVEYCRGIDDAIAIIRQHVAAPDVLSEISVISDLPKRLRIVSGMINMGEKISWGEETALMDQAADEIDRLSKPVSVSQIAEKVNPCDEGDMEFYKDHVRTVLDAAGVTCHE